MSRKHDHAKELPARAKAKRYQREAHKEKERFETITKDKVE
jgi:hypothetical protein